VDSLVEDGAKKVESIMSKATPQIIKHAFPLKQPSLDSTHEIRIWPGYISALSTIGARQPIETFQAETKEE